VSSILGNAHALAIAAGGTRTCALMTTGGVRCWGWDAYGQLGDGNLGWYSTPTMVAGICE
jgi:alpha-tubulin suppressor-like RCC1 family protein